GARTDGYVGTGFGALVIDRLVIARVQVLDFELNRGVHRLESDSLKLDRSRSAFSAFEHDLFANPVPTFPDHALETHVLPICGPEAAHRRLGDTRIVGCDAAAAHLDHREHVGGRIDGTLDEAWRRTVLH